MCNKFVDFYNSKLKSYINDYLWLNNNVKLFNITNVWPLKSYNIVVQVYIGHIIENDMFY